MNRRKDAAPFAWTAVFPEHAEREVLDEDRPACVAKAIFARFALMAGR